MIKVIGVSTNDPELFVKELVEAFRGDHQEDGRRADEAERMFGLKIGGNGKPRPRRKTADAVLTARNDLVEIREALLAGDDRKALRRADWTLDQIDNWLAEN